MLQEDAGPALQDLCCMMSLPPGKAAAGSDQRQHHHTVAEATPVQ